MTETKPLYQKIITLVLAVAFMATGISLSIKASLGITPISSIPYVTSLIGGLSVGTMTIIINVFFVFLQILILRREFKPFQLLQIPTVILFGMLIDAAGLLIDGLVLPNYVTRLICCISGIVILAFGVTLEVRAQLVTVPGEGLVLALCQKLPIKFGNMKIIVDVSFVVISVVLSLVFLGSLQGIREGTVLAALLVGFFSKQFLRIFDSRKAAKKAVVEEPVEEYEG